MYSVKHYACKTVCKFKKKQRWRNMVQDYVKEFNWFNFRLKVPTFIFLEATIERCSYPSNNYMFKVNNRNTRTKVWNMFKVNNKAIKTTPLEKMFWKCAANLREISMPKRKVAKQHYWNHILACSVNSMFCKHLFLRTPMESCFCTLTFPFRTAKPSRY